MAVLFWISLLLILYTYLGYMLVVALRRRMMPNKIHKAVIAPFVSVVIAAYNEEQTISQRLKNLLLHDYPKDRLEIIVVSDGSTDNTVKEVAAFIDQGVQVADLVGNQGKAIALNHGVAMARGEIIIFADSRQKYLPDAISKLVSNFADPSTGCVSGELHFQKDPDSKIEAEMGAYWRYEKFIRRSESGSGSVIGATGCIYAIRRDLYQPLPAGTILDDVLTPMNIARKGKRVLFEEKAVAYDIISKNATQEWRRKVRTLAGNWQMLSLAPWIVLPWENPLWLRYLSHKLMRLLVPFGLVILLVASLLLPGSFSRPFAFLQLVFYAMALTGFLLPASRSIRLVNLSYFFVVMNAAAVVGFWKWVTGGCATAWQSASCEKEMPRG